MQSATPGLPAARGQGLAGHDARRGAAFRGGAWQVLRRRRFVQRAFCLSETRQSPGGQWPSRTGGFGDVESQVQATGCRPAPEPISGGGCSGLQYGMKLEAEKADDDWELEIEGVKLLVDAMTLPMIDNVTVDFVDTLTHTGFKFDNPNASAQCSCGSSFSV
jgi:iron-sulfur cluster assembly protein